MGLPSKKRYPDYYQTIKKPVALDMISVRAGKDEYDDMDGLKADLNLMTSNAKKYNVKESSIYQDAVVLQVPPIPVGCVGWRLIVAENGKGFPE
jgi:hypothetical protein